MTITELIAALEALRSEHGDLPVKVPDRWTVGDPRPHLGPSDEPPSVWL